MKNKGYHLLIVVLLALCSIPALSVFAHPGSLDSNGGHWDRKNGTYHFHEGKNTSGTSTPDPDYEYPYADFEPPYDPPTENPYRNDSTSSSANAGTAAQSNELLISLFIIFILFPIFGLTIEFVAQFFPGSYIYELQKLIKQLEESQEKFTEYKAIYSEDNPESIIPEKYEIGDDGKPKEKDCKHWGDTFTIYTSKKGVKLHSKYMCSGASIPKNIVDFRNCYDLSSRLCKRCCKSYIVQDFSWYEHYLSYNSKRAEYINTKERIFRLHEQIANNLIKFDSKFFKFCLFFCRWNKRKLKVAEYKYAAVSANSDIIHTFLPLSQVKTLIDMGAEENWIIAERLNIPEAFVSFAIDVYTNEGALN